MLPEELWEAEVIRDRWDMPVAQEEKQYKEWRETGEDWHIEAAQEAPHLPVDIV